MTLGYSLVGCTYQIIYSVFVGNASKICMGINWIVTDSRKNGDSKGRSGRMRLRFSSSSMRVFDIISYLYSSFSFFWCQPLCWGIKCENCTLFSLNKDFVKPFHGGKTVFFRFQLSTELEVFTFNNLFNNNLKFNTVITKKNAQSLLITPILKPNHGFLFQITF